MEVRQRAKSPVGRKSLFVGDVSGARKAGKAETQELQRPYVNKFMKTLEKVYPENTRISDAQPKTGVFVIPVYCFGSKTDAVSIVTSVKKEFPNAQCETKSSTEHVWKLPYIQPAVPKQWGSIIFWMIFIIMLTFSGYMTYNFLQ
jgi:hypothetical protein